MSTQIRSGVFTVFNVTPRNSGFAVEHGSGTKCFIPKKVTHASGVRVGDVVEMDYVDNPNETCVEGTPLMAIRVGPVGGNSEGE